LKFLWPESQARNFLMVAGSSAILKKYFPSWIRKSQNSFFQSAAESTEGRAFHSLFMLRSFFCAAADGWKKFTMKELT
jgi:hypothetical protein